MCERKRKFYCEHYTYAYNSLNKLSGVTNNAGQSFSYLYDAAGRLSEINYPNSIKTQVSFDQNSRVSGINHSKSGTNFEQFSYGRDPVGNILSSLSANSSKNFTYDEVDQLVASNTQDSILGSFGELFTFDKVGNRTSSEFGSYAYDDKKYRLEEDYQYLYVYDLNGNLTSRQKKGMAGEVWNYTYNSDDKLVHLEYYFNSVKVREVDYAYDAMGRRIRKHVKNFDETQSEFERNYVYDVNEIVAELDDNGNVLARYTQSGLRTDDVLSADISNAGVQSGLAISAGTFFYFKDHIGSVVAVTSESGQVVQKYLYSSYGKLLKKVDVAGLDTAAINTPFTFTNREFDEESGLYYLRARYYDPVLSRFITADPLYSEEMDKRGTDSQELNLYAYAKNNPINNLDPNGLAAIALSAEASAFVFRGGAFKEGAVISVDLNPFSKTFGRTEVAALETQSAKFAFGGGVGASGQVEVTLGNSTVKDLEGKGAGVSASLMGYGLGLSFGQGTVSLSGSAPQLGIGPSAHIGVDASEAKSLGTKVLFDGFYDQTPSNGTQDANRDSAPEMTPINQSEPM